MRTKEISSERKTIVDVAIERGCILHGEGGKRWLRCPLPGHDDDRASAVIFLNSGRFHCAVCTPGSSLDAKAFSQRLSGVSYGGENPIAFSSVPHQREQTKLTPESLSANAIAEIWTRARNGAELHADPTNCKTHDADVHRYLASRHLENARTHQAFGVLSPSMPLPAELRRWAYRGYRILVPLYAMRTGEIQSLQARSILPNVNPKTLLLRTISIQGAAFANAHALALIRRQAQPRTVILAEGLTDHLALTIHADVAVFSAPGASAAIALMNSWIKGRRLVVALDRDAAGDAAAREVMRRAFLLRTSSIQRLIWPEPSKDACEALTQLGPEVFSRFLESWTKEH